MINKKIVYFILVYTLIFTFPVLYALFSQIPGKYSDTYQVWGKTLAFQNKIEDDGLFGTLYYQIIEKKFSPIETIGWLQTFTGDYFGYNLVWLSSFFIAALGMYFLVVYLTRNRLAGLFSAIIFSFSPFHISQAISTNIGTMHYEWIPFYVLFLIRFLRNLRFKDFLLCCLFLVLVAFSESQLLAFTLVFTIVFSLAFLAKNSEKILSLKFAAYAVAGMIAVFIAVKFIFGGLFDVAHSDNNYLDPGMEQVKRYSADASELFIPHSFHPIWGDKTLEIREDLSSNQQGRKSTYIGYTVLLFSILSLFSYKRRMFIKLFFFGSGVLFAVLTFGPVINWFGETKEGIWTPYQFLYDFLPYWDIIRTVSRVFVISILCFAVSAGFGLDFVLRKINEKLKRNLKSDKKIVKSVNIRKRASKKVRREKVDVGSLKDLKKELKKYLTIKKKAAIYWIKDYLKRREECRKELEKMTYKELIIGFFKKRTLTVITLGFILLVSVEYLSIPISTMSMKHSNFYEMLREKEGNFSIIDIPGSTSYEYASLSMIHNEIHRRHNYAGKDLARVIDDKWDFQENTPILNDLLYSLPTGGKPPSKEIINDYYYNLGTKIFNFYNIEYILVSKRYRNSDKNFDGQAFENTLNFIDGEIDSELVYEDEYLVAFKVNKSQHIGGWFLAMDLKGDYWSSKEGKAGSVARWARDGAKMKIVNLSANSEEIRLKFQTRIKSIRNIEVYLNDRLVYDDKLKDEKEDHEVILDYVIPGENSITFRIFDMDGEPVRSYELDRGVKISDVRTLGQGEK